MNWKEFFKPSKLTKWSKTLFFIGILIIIVDFITVRRLCDRDMICAGVQHILTGIVSGILLVIILILLLINKFKK